MAWYENLGNGEFGPARVIDANADAVHRVHAADLDGDGDPDVLSACHGDDTVAWYENLGNSAFGPKQVITSRAHEPGLIRVTGGPIVAAPSIWGPRAPPTGEHIAGGAIHRLDRA